MKKTFGKLVNGKLNFAPCFITKENGAVISNPTEQQYIDAGYNEVIDDGGQGMISPVFCGYEQHNGKIKTRYFESHVESISKRPLSKLKIKLALCKLGIDKKFRDWLRATDIMLDDGMIINCFDAWNDAQVIDVNDPLFGEYLEKAKEVFKQYISEEQLGEILKNCEV